MPVDIGTMAAFIVAVLAIVLSPGPDTMLILRYTLTSGQRAGLATLAGVQVGILLHTSLAILGISVIIASSPILFRSIGIMGAFYLGWLGLQGFRDGGNRSFDSSAAAVSPAKACRDAVLCNLLNPKVILLFLAIFPNFVDTAKGSVNAQLLILAAILIVLNILWQAPLVLAARALRAWLQKARVQRIVSQSTGAVLLAFAAALLFEHLR